MENQIDNDLKLALKSGDKFTLSVLRMLKSEIINESRKGSLHTLTDDEVLKVIKKGVKTRKDSIEEYKKYGKLDTVNELAKEVDILNKYLPQEMSEEEIIKIVNEVFEELKPSSMKDMGNLMKVISSKITNADMSLVSKIVKDKLLS
ncbi:MAG: GatB/YqeY domain-containing protein [Bacilli bacterium]|nr:GatB/YqeY domain-containing protein [Bacilli bacterium]MDY4618747.1 GatB/YqeY domain-containing protein [Bacilli bacterium]